MWASEEKHRYNGVINSTYDITPAYIDLCVAKGQGENRENSAVTNIAQRDGNKVQPVSLSLWAIVSPGDSANIVRICVTHYKVPPIGGTPAFSDWAYQGPSTDYTAVMATYNRDNVPSKIEICYDKKILVNTYSPQKVVKWSKNLWVWNSA